MFSTFSSISSIHKNNKSGVPPITLNITNPNGTSLGFWAVSNSIKSFGTYTDDSVYGGGAVVISDNGQLICWCRNTLTQNKLYTSSNWLNGTANDVTPTAYASAGYAYNAWVSRGSGSTYGIISVRNYSANPVVMISSDLNNWSFCTASGINSSVQPDVQCSSNGQYMLLSGAASGFTHYLSSDYGATWSSLSSTVTFASNSNFMSEDGSKMAIVANGGNSKYSTNYGVSWATFYNSANPSSSLCLTEDFSKGILGSPGTVRVITSTSASTFVSLTPKTSTGGQKVTCNQSGTRMAYVRCETGQAADAFYSVDSGTTFTNVNTQFSTSLNFVSVCMSQSGQYCAFLAKEGLYMLYIP